MPVVTVSALVGDEGAVQPILARVAARLAECLGRPVGDVWVRLVAVAAATSGSDPETVTHQHPTFELVTGSLGPERERAALEAVAHAVAEGFGLPVVAVWGRFVPLERGRLFADGSVR